MEGDDSVEYRSHWHEERIKHEMALARLLRQIQRTGRRLYRLSRGSRSNFNTRQFASQNALGLPAAAVYFNS
ncbi:hypothetical protein IC582_005281 [Cucumis melo]